MSNSSFTSKVWDLIKRRKLKLEETYGRNKCYDRKYSFMRITISFYSCYSSKPVLIIVHIIIIHIMIVSSLLYLSENSCAFSNTWSKFRDKVSSVFVKSYFRVFCRSTLTRTFGIAKFRRDLCLILLASCTHFQR